MTDRPDNDTISIDLSNLLGFQGLPPVEEGADLTRVIDDTHNKIGDATGEEIERAA